MRIAITCRFQNSYFSGALPQVAVILGRAFKTLGHDVVLVYPKGDSTWFVDFAGMAAEHPPTQEWREDLVTQPWDLVVEATWSFPAAIRPQIAKRYALFHHYPPIFHDMESTVYPFNPMHRDFTNATECWTWDLYGQQDLHYLAFLSGGKPVYTLPFAADFDFLDDYVRSTGVPEWSVTAREVDGKVKGDVPATLSWSARIVESNASNASHCVMPLNIVSEIRRVDPIRFSVHNGEQVANNAFFQSNVAKNLLLPDISGNFVPRIRLPDLRREKSFLVAHQRFRPLKRFLLDALYLGIPVIHNSVTLKGWGYWYDLNQIPDAVAAWKRMLGDYEKGQGYFAAGAAEIRQKALKAKYGREMLDVPLTKILQGPVNTPTSLPRMIIEDLPASTNKKELRLWFCDMWDQFQPEHNFFVSLFRWAGSQQGFRVTLDHRTPNLLIYGPFGDMHKLPQFEAVPKIHFTGENTPPVRTHNTFLNLGYAYVADRDYIRLPLWVLEINWFGEDPNKIVNPRPVPLESCLAQDAAVLDTKTKFCAFVATNPRCQNRNLAFHVLNEWRGVDAGGRLFCNLPGGPVPAGLGGGGGEHAKVDFYKAYKYAITYENESAPGYTTEKLFHAKVAGCVPIYWGDKFVDRDFDSKGFINANGCRTPEDLKKLVEDLEADPVAWRRMAEQPALSAYKRHWCERIMEEIVKATMAKVLGISGARFGADAWKDATEFHTRVDAAVASTQTPVVASGVGKPKRIVTAANANFIPSVYGLLQSLKQQESEKNVPVCVYVWPDVTAEMRERLAALGAAEVRELPVGTSMGWSDFWAPQHFAWKLWIHQQEVSVASASAAAGTLVLYMDSGIEVVGPMDPLWNQIATEDMCLIDDGDHPNKRWCHRSFCEALQVSPAELEASQIWAGCMGFKVGGKYAHIHRTALDWAQREDVITGKKSARYSDVCLGHRHDQSILSVLTTRAGIRRIPIASVYCDKARRTAVNWGVPLYVHRGTPKPLEPVLPGIDDAYVINLERRADRLNRFKTNTGVRNAVNVWRATDGRALTMTPQLAYLFRDNDFKWKKAVMGCAISHMGLWERLAKDQIATSYLICEDDARLRPDWREWWTAAAPHIPTDADVVYLGGVLPPNKAAFPSVIEPVNAHFARVAKNDLFGGTARRYFHFCNYAYVLTRSGAQKLCRLIMERGIFTSGDHMIVNHGDGLLNIYFTRPMIADCYQEDDPVYQRSDFNNFARLDAFDSDLWNNNDHFTQEDVTLALAVEMRKIEIKVVKEPISEAEKAMLEKEHAAKLASAASPAPPTPTAAPTAAPTPTQQKPTKEVKLALWNDFLRAVALRKSEQVRDGLDRIFAAWNTTEDVQEDMSWFRVLEQLILTNHPELAAAKKQVGDLLVSRGFIGLSMWEKITKHWSLVAPAPTVTPSPSKKTTIFFLKGNDPSVCLENEWLQTLFPGGIEWVACELISDLLLPVQHTPILVYQNPHGMVMTSSLHTILDAFQSMNRKLALLHISDEFARDDISMYGHPAVAHVFRNYWRTGLDKARVTVFPLGFTTGRGKEASTHAQIPFGSRKTTWSFVGSLDRPGRTEALKQLRDGSTDVDYLCQTKASWGAPAVQEGETYCQTLANSKFVPCMRGSVALESFRVYEALEHGAIPVFVPAESHNCADEFREMYGDHPFLAVPSWSEAATVMKRLEGATNVMEEHRQKVVAWWRDRKMQVIQKIHEVIGKS